MTATSWRGLNQTSVGSFQLPHTLPVEAPILSQPVFVKSVEFRGARHSVLWIAIRDQHALEDARRRRRWSLCWDERKRCLSN
jgi:hypothetical protein